MTEVIKPVNEYAKNTSNNIGKSFDTSENTLISGIRKWSSQL